MEEVEEIGRRKEDGDDVPRRRGKKVKGKKKPLNVHKGSMGIVEPGETQVSTCIDGVGEGEDEEGGADKEEVEANKPAALSWYSDKSSIFDVATLRHLRRNMADTDAFSEYRTVWQRVYQEALAACKMTPEEELGEVAKQLSLPNTDPDQWMHVPRLFAYSNARFHLPLDRNTLKAMTPLQYLTEHVRVAKEKKLIYNHVYKKYASMTNGELLRGQNVIPALGDIMGKRLEEDEVSILEEYFDIDDNENHQLLTWYGICAFTERILGPRISSKQDFGRRPEIEVADFHSLHRMLSTVTPCAKLHKLLKTVDSMGQTRREQKYPRWTKIMALLLLQE